MREDLITASEAARRLGVTRSWIIRLCAQGRIPGARKIGPVWAVPVGAKVKEAQPGRPLRTTEIPPGREEEVEAVSRTSDEWITVTEAARRMDVSRQRVLKLCVDGRVQGARKIGRRWMIPAGAKITDPSRPATSPLRTTEIPRRAGKPRRKG